MARGSNRLWLLAIAGVALLAALTRRATSSSDTSSAAAPAGPGGYPYSPTNTASSGGSSAPFAPVDPFAAPAGDSALTDLNQLNRSNSSLDQRRAAFGPYFAAAEARYGIPSGLLLQQGIAESSLDPSAASSAGAVGIMQMLPRYFPGAGQDAITDINTAAKEMMRLYGVFGSWTLALAGYNAGQGNVEKYGGVPPFAETQAYVAKIMTPVFGGDQAVWA